MQATITLQDMNHDNQRAGGWKEVSVERLRLNGFSESVPENKLSLRTFYDGDVIRLRIGDAVADITPEDFIQVIKLFPENQSYSFNVRDD